MALDRNDLDGDLNTTEYRTYAVHEDFQGTVWGLSDVAGELVERYRYREPYGDSFTEDSSETNIGDFASEVFHRKRLHGGVTDQVMKLYDFRNRWLNPESGSWLTRDPLGLVDSENLYQAFVVDPLALSDPGILDPDWRRRWSCQTDLVGVLVQMRGDHHGAPGVFQHVAGGLQDVLPPVAEARQ